MKLEKMKIFKISIIVLILICSLLSANKNRLVFQQGFILNAYHNDEYKEIKRAESFYGFGWISKDLVFIATQDEGTSEAVANLEIYDVKNDVVFPLTSLGGTGETNFDVNKKTKKIVFNDSDGIKILKVDTLDFSYSIDLLVDEADGFGVFWINEDTIGFEDYNHSGSKKFIKMNAVRTPYYQSFRYQNLESKSKKELRLLRNEIFARHNQSFKSEDLKWHFEHKNWYKEKVDHTVSASELNNVEKGILRKIKSLELKLK